MFCKNCGSDLNLDFKFCKNCGEKIEEVEETVLNEESVTEEKDESNKIEELKSVFCKKCGTKLEETTKFCFSCGENQQQGKFNSGNYSEMKNKVSKLFSKNPDTIITESMNDESKKGFILIGLYLVLFGFVSCINFTQIINYLANKVQHIMLSTIAGPVSGFASGFVQDFHMPILYSMFIPFVLIGCVFVFIEIPGIYLIFKYNKIDTKSFLNIVNLVSVSVLPIIAGLCINLLVGFIFPLVTVAVIMTSYIIHMLFIFIGLQKIPELKSKITFMYSLLIFVIFLVFTVVFSVLYSIILEELFINLKNISKALLGNIL